MTHDEALERLDLYLDGELSDAEAGAFEEHLADCRGCTADLESLRALTGALGRIPEEGLDGFEAEAVRAAAEEMARSPRRTTRVPPAAWLALAAAVALLLAIGLPVLLSSGSKTTTKGGAGRSGGTSAQDAAQPAVGAPEAGAPDRAAAEAGSAFTATMPQPQYVSAGRSYSDPEQVEEVLKSDPGFAAFRDAYRASDVGALQATMQTEVSSKAPQGAGRTPAECMNVVFRSVPRPVLPAYVERARYNGTDAWILAFAFTGETSPDAPLTEILFYAMATEDCSFLATASFR